MHHLPIFSGNHFNRIPGTTVEEGAIRAFADALLTTDAEIGIDFDAAEWCVIFIGHPEHARFDWTVLDARGRAGAAGAAVGGDCQDARLLFARGFAIAFRHRPMLFDHVEYSFFCECGHA